MACNLVGVSGSTGRVDCGESCEVVSFQVSTGVEVRGQQNKNAHVEVLEGMGIVRKALEHSKGSIMLLSTRKDTWRFWGVVVTCEYMYLALVGAISLCELIPVGYTSNPDRVAIFCISDW